MKNKIPIKMALCIIVLAVATVVIINQMNENNRLREKLDSVKHVLPFSQIQYDLVQLEGAIAYQMQAQWKEPAHVREKVGDVMQDIMVLISECSNRYDVPAREAGHSILLQSDIGLSS